MTSLMNLPANYYLKEEWHRTPYWILVIDEKVFGEYPSKSIAEQAAREHYAQSLEK